MTIANINTLARFLTNTDSVSFTDANLLILVNASYERITGRLLAETAGSKWQYGDSNYTAFPDYVADLVDSQDIYDLTTIFSDTPLKILGVEVLDQDGNYQVVFPVGFSQIRRVGIAQTEYAKTDGRPFQYELRENQIVLKPAPDNGVTVTLTDGLKIFYLRTADVYTSAQVSTGTKVPGFPSPWHDIIAYESAFQYAMANALPNANFLKGEVDRKEKEMLEFISRRNQDNKPVMRMRGSRQHGHLTPDGGHHHGHHFI